MDEAAISKRPTVRPDWTLQRVRRLLADAVENSGLLPDGNRQTWPGVSAAILEATGVDYPHERLRQFVYGEERQGRRHYVRPQADRIEAVISWMTDSDDPLVTLDALEREEFVTQPPLCLVDVLGTKETELLAKEKLLGAFAAGRSVSGREESIVLTFHPFSANGMWHVTETRTVKEKAKTFVEESAGWSIVSSEDQILLFMREPKHAINHRWLLVSDADLWSDEPVNNLMLLRQSYPYDRDSVSVSQSLKNDVFHFRRHEGA